MDKHTVTFRVRYAETDQSCVVHHSVYPVWFEMGRVELLRSSGLNYTELERQGFFFVVVDLHVRYRQPARFDDELEIETSRSGKTKVTIEHNYRITRPSDGELLTEGSTLIACINSKGRPCRIPGVMLEAISAV